VQRKSEATSNMLKVLVVIGTRPEAIKFAPVVKSLQRQPHAARVSVCVTAQHREMMDQALARVGLTADHDLDVMTHSQTPSDVAAAVLHGIQDVLAKEQPDWVLVQGDTTTTAAGALAAAYAGCKVAHVEAGLRTYDMQHPFPEEMNRCLVTQIASLHFPPTPWARDNLLREGVAPEKIFVTGNTGIDALFATVAGLESTSPDEIMSDLPADARVVLATAHRRENSGAPLARICAALGEVSRLEDNIYVIYPLHPRPEVYETVCKLLGDAPRVLLCKPFDHAGLLKMMLRSELVITDSGGLQEEAPSLGRPVVVLREFTERPEAIKAGMATLVGSDHKRIVAAARKFLANSTQGKPVTPAQLCYGDGKAADRITAVLLGEKMDPWIPETIS